MNKFYLSLVMLFLYACDNVVNPGAPLANEHKILVDTVNRQIIEYGEGDSGKKIILYDNGTWAYAPVEKKVNNSKRKKKRAPKRIREERAMSTATNLLYTAPSPGNPENSSSSSTTSSYATPRTSFPSNSSYVGTCGALTRKGRACQRRVRGGGHCWQHGG
jgi:hypothetical protein